MESNMKPCMNCRRRKVRCDKTAPCANCVRLKQDCVFEDAQDETEPAVALDQPGKIELFDRLAKLESVVQDLKESLSLTLQGHTSRLSPSGINQRTTTDSVEPNTSVFDPEPFHQSREDLSSRITGGNPRFPFNFPVSHSHSAPDHFPSEHESNLLYQLFLDTAEPFIRIIHVSSFKAILHNFHLHGQPVEFETLLQSVRALSVITLPPQFFRDMFGRSPRDLLESLQFSVESSLVKVNFLSSTHNMTLQALIYYITFLFLRRENAKASAILGIALRQALRIGIHRDPDSCSPPMSLLDADARRRLWSYLQHLDFRAQERFGVERSIQFIPSWDTKPPMNVDECFWEDLAAGGADATDQKGYTDMSFAIGQTRIDNLHRELTSMASNAIIAQLDSTRAIKSAIDDCRRGIEQDFLSHIDPQIPIQKVVALILRFRLLKVEIIARRKEPVESTLDVVTTFQQLLLQFENDPDLARWRWLHFPKYEDIEHT